MRERGRMGCCPGHIPSAPNLNVGAAYALERSSPGPGHKPLVPKPPRPNPNQVPISSKTQLNPKGPRADDFMDFKERRMICNILLFKGRPDRGQIEVR